MLAPMIALEKVMQKSVVGRSRTSTSRRSRALSFSYPRSPSSQVRVCSGAAIDQGSWRHPNYTGSCVRVAHHFNKIYEAFTAPDGPKALDHVACPAMLTIHANADTMTEPGGSVHSSSAPRVSARPSS